MRCNTRQRIDERLQRFHRFKVARRVHEYFPVVKPRHVIDLQGCAFDGVSLSVKVEHDELAERFHRTECADVRLGLDGAPTRRDFECVGLVRLELQDLGVILDGDRAPREACIRVALRLRDRVGEHQRIGASVARERGDDVWVRRAAERERG